MPSTRRQVAKLKAKKVIAIPPKYDTSLFQKKGDCIEGMPIPIFQIIQKFLNEQDYLDLMNANLLTFQPIKYETVHYTLVGPERWSNFDFCADEYKEATVVQIINGVKDKSKQVAMRIKGVTQTILFKYAHLFEGIGKLTLEHATLGKDFAFHIFSKIRRLKLSGVDGLNRQPFQADFDFANLEELELNCCRVSEIIAWNSSKSLKKVIISSCSPLSSLPPLDDIPVVFIMSTSVTHLQSIGHHKEFSCVGSTLDNETLALLNQPSFYKGLQSLSLCCTFNNPDLLFCQNIPFVDLYNSSNSYRNDFYPPLPVLYGKELKIQHFSLASWNGQLFSNVVRCDLKNCLDLIHFPQMEALQSLKLENCSTLVGIPSLSSLKDLWIRGCFSLKRVCFCPNLVKVTVDRCQDFDDLSSFSHVQDASLHYCHKVTSIVPFQHVPKVLIRCCTGIIDLERISNSQDDYMLTRRTITISDVTIPTKLQNIYHLVLERYAEKLDISLIENVHHLELRTGLGLVTTKRLRNVTGSLILDRCSKLTSLEGLENIPEVSIICCPNILHFTGLGHCQKLTVRWNSMFEKMLLEFRKEKKHSELFESIEHLYFHSQGFYPHAYSTAECIW
jgi:hypothetical protein